MTEKEEIIFKIIIEYVKENNTMPSRRFIQRKLNFKSINSITQYFKSLEKKGYLKHVKHKYIIGNSIYDSGLKKIKIINLKNSEIEVILNKKKNYIGYKLNNNYFRKSHLLKNDILIIEKKNALHEGDLGLFIIDNNYRIMTYNYKDGFFLLSDNETIYLNHVKIIGKVIKIIRTI